MEAGELVKYEFLEISKKILVNLMLWTIVYFLVLWPGPSIFQILFEQPFSASLVADLTTFYLVFLLMLACAIGLCICYVAAIYIKSRAGSTTSSSYAFAQRVVDELGSVEINFGSLLIAVSLTFFIRNAQGEVLWSNILQYFGAGLSFYGFAYISGIFGKIVFQRKLGSCFKHICNKFRAKISQRDANRHAASDEE